MIHFPVTKETTFLFDSVLVNNTDDKKECARHLYVGKVNPSNISLQKCSWFNPGRIIQSLTQAGKHMQTKTHLSVRVEINECDEAVSPPGGAPLLLQPFFLWPCSLLLSVLKAQKCQPCYEQIWGLGRFYLKYQSGFWRERGGVEVEARLWKLS